MKLTKKHLAISATLLAVIVSLCLARAIFRQVPVTEPTEIYIPTGSTFQALGDTLAAHQCIASRASFSTVARLRSLPQHVKGGRYVVQPGMSQFRLVNKLRSGNQDALRLTLGKHRTPEQLCAFLASKLEMEADSMLALMTDSAVAARYNLTPATMLCLFIPNTYDIYWNTSPEHLLDRMQRESDRFWTPTRQAQCRQLGMTRAEVITLASIVEEETNQNDEKPDVASVYLNRLRRGMMLQADPTVKYAVGDFTLRRILHKHLAVESPYNTYQHQGLPPGPICIPSVKSIDAVLENKSTSYLYFCAKEDFSGRHNFAATPAEHMANAARFHKALNRKGIC